MLQQRIFTLRHRKNVGEDDVGYVDESDDDDDDDADGCDDFDDY